MRISVYSEKDKIPHIINGASANSMFWIIKHKKFIESGGQLEQHEVYSNTSFLSLPYDLDDFSRCVLVSDFFGYTETEINIGLHNIETMEGIIQKNKFIFLFKNFLKMRELYKDGDFEPVKKFLNELDNIEED